MDIDALINAIYDKVQERITAQESSGSCETDGCYHEKPKFLILADAHGDICHQALECPVLGRYYQMECALLMDCCCDITDYEAVLAYTMTNENLGKIACGIIDSDYTRLFSQALLAGRKIFVPEDEIELFRYRETAPAAYYARMEDNVKLLQDSGVIIAPNRELQACILDGKTPSSEPPCLPQEPGQEEREFVISKRVITERDLIAAKEQKVCCVVVNQKAILTDLAKDYAGKQRITIQRGCLGSSKGRQDV